MPIILATQEMEANQGKKKFNEELVLTLLFYPLLRFSNYCSFHLLANYIRYSSSFSKGNVLIA
jgi:hypothetical protein